MRIFWDSLLGVLGSPEKTLTGDKKGFVLLFFPNECMESKHIQLALSVGSRLALPSSAPCDSLMSVDAPGRSACLGTHNNTEPQKNEPRRYTIEDEMASRRHLNSSCWLQFSFLACFRLSSQTWSLYYKDMQPTATSPQMLDDSFQCHTFYCEDIMTPLCYCFLFTYRLWLVLCHWTDSFVTFCFLWYYMLETSLTSGSLNSISTINMSAKCIYCQWASAQLSPDVSSLIPPFIYFCFIHFDMMGVGVIFEDYVCFLSSVNMRTCKKWHEIILFFLLSPIIFKMILSVACKCNIIYHSDGPTNPFQSANLWTCFMWIQNTAS